MTEVKTYLNIGTVAVEGTNITFTAADEEVDSYSVDMEYGEPVMSQDTSGDYVKRSDYDALLAELRQALEQARDAALEEAAKLVDPAANAKRGLWAENLRKKAAAIRALQSTTTKEEE